MSTPGVGTVPSGAGSAQPLPVGSAMPEFAARNQYGETVRSADLHGAASWVMFYPFAFSRVCGAELAQLHARWSEVAAHDVRVLAVSCDAMHSLRAYAEHLQDQAGAQGEPVGFDLLSDFWPHGEISAAFGAFDADLGASQRVSFFCDAEGRIRHIQQAELSEERELDQALELLAQLS
ncbi:redoxin domain-containing protein [Nesterenkonia cremea]|uniref:Peroxiredoxin n=1 Tax=Nesterenkonia cremea TaxID=1882340 RepID=A0A917ARF0_9MICC|nr:redoxin domain-containing protein [Nesterenkonia cremea]GGE68491.1 peroxiredoxin [Nesterenkonia cremea]